MALDLGLYLEGGQSNFQVKVSSNDTAGGFLIDKIFSSDGSVTITQNNDGGNEKLDIVVGSTGGDNFANADLTLDDNRAHDLKAFKLRFTDPDSFALNPNVLVLEPSEKFTQLGYNNNIASEDLANIVIGPDNNTSTNSGESNSIVGSGNTMNLASAVSPRYTNVFGTNNTIDNTGSSIWIQNTVLGTNNVITNGRYNTLVGNNLETANLRGNNFVAGTYVKAGQSSIISIGRYLESTAEASNLIGSGVSTSSRLTNSIQNSIGFGWYETTPSVFFAKTADNYINGTGDLGIGLNSGISAKLHIKGSGATSATTAFHVENDSASSLIDMKDDGTFAIGLNATNDYNTNVIIGKDASSSSVGGWDVVIGEGAKNTWAGGSSPGLSVAVGKNSRVSRLGTVVGYLAVGDAATGISIFGVSNTATGQNGRVFGDSNTNNGIFATLISSNATIGANGDYSIVMTGRYGGSDGANNVVIGGQGRYSDINNVVHIGTGSYDKGANIFSDENANRVFGNMRSPKTNVHWSTLNQGIHHYYPTLNTTLTQNNIKQFVDYSTTDVVSSTTSATASRNDSYSLDFGANVLNISVGDVLHIQGSNSTYQIIAVVNEISGSIVTLDKRLPNNNTFGNVYNVNETVLANATIIKVSDFTMKLRNDLGTEVDLFAGGGGGNTIYTADDSLSSDRVVTLNNNSLSFRTNSGGTKKFSLSSPLYSGTYQQELVLDSHDWSTLSIYGLGGRGTAIYQKSNDPLTTANNLALGATGAGGQIFFGTGTGTTTASIRGNFSDNGLRIGPGVTESTAALEVQGSGATSATTSLLIENNSSSQLFKIDDSGGFALGVGATYGSDSTVSIGRSATATGSIAIAIGRDTDATNTYTVALGYLTQATGSGAMAFGYQSNASAGQALAIGYQANSTTSGIGIGQSANAAATQAIAIGRSAVTGGADGVSIGYLANAVGAQSVAVGRQASTSGGGQYGAAIGWLATSIGERGVAMGYNTSSSARGVAIGNEAVCDGYGVAIGNQALTDFNQSGLAIGNGARVGNVASAMTFSAASLNATRTNSTTNTAEFYLASTTPVFRFGETADGYLNTTGSFGFGTNLPAASAVVDLDSTTKGFLPPRMTTTEKNAIVAPATGLMVFDTTLAKLCVYTGSAWETITSA